MKLEIRNITKTYGNTVALKNITIEMQEGIYGILGENGAGKSTLINLLTDSTARDKVRCPGGKQIEKSGIFLDGKEILELGEAYREMIGYMPQQQGISGDFSVYSFLMYIAGLKKIKRKEAKRQTEERLNKVNLWKHRFDRLGALSGGMRQRVLFAAATLGEPKILLLDEPTAGLDPYERVNLRNQIAELGKDKIIILATHLVADIECIADQVLVMKQGQLLHKVTSDELLEMMRGKVGELSCTKEEIAEYRRRYGTINVLQRNGRMVLRFVGDELPEGAEPVVDNISLEDVYMYYFEKAPMVSP